MKTTILDIAITLWTGGIFETLNEAYDYLENLAKGVQNEIIRKQKGN